MEQEEKDEVQQPQDTTQVDTDENKVAPSQPEADNAAQEGKEQLTLFKKKKRNGKYISKLDSKTLDNLQRRKSLFMYLSTLFFAVSLFLEVEGRTKLSEAKQVFWLFTLYVLLELVLIVFTVIIAVFNRTSQKIGPELKEKNVPYDGLDRHTFRSYEWFNLLHILLAAGEVAVSIYGFLDGFGVWGFLNIIVSVASAGCCIVSRQILFKANADNLEFLEGREDAEEETKSRRKEKKKKEKRQ